jgi:hypothetical protein
MSMTTKHKDDRNEFYELALQWYNVAKGYADEGNRREMIKCKVNALICLDKAKKR